MVKPTTVMLDMDGVIANFIGGAISAHGQDFQHDDVDEWNWYEKHWGMSDEDFWIPLNSERFWVTLRRYSWSCHVLEVIKEELGSDVEICFCTNPGHFVGAIPAKIRWLKNEGFMGDDCHTQQFIPTSRKGRLAKPDVLLIDDSGLNVQEFALDGGQAILFPQPWNANRCHVGQRIGYLKEQLKLIANEAGTEQTSNFPSLENASAETRKASPLITGFLDYFPNAAVEVARVSKAGNDQHNPGQPLHWDKTKSSDHADCIGRHLIQRGTIDTDNQRHSAKVAWRAMALLEEELTSA